MAFRAISREHYAEEFPGKLVSAPKFELLLESAALRSIRHRLARTGDVQGDA